MSLKYKHMNVICKKRIYYDPLVTDSYKTRLTKQFTITINIAPFAVHQSVDSLYNHRKS